MEKRTNIRPLVYMAIPLAIIILIGVVTLRKPDLEYIMSIENIHEHVLTPGDEIYPWDAQTIAAEDQERFQFIDLRNEYEFSLGAIGNAINIPQHSLLLDDNIDILESMEEDSVIMILYGHNQLQANGPWMILKQLGFSNIRTLAA